MYFNLNFSVYEFTIIILGISFFDSFCYITGKIFGKKKLFIKISPNKTLEGLIGGIIATNLLVVLIFIFFEFIIINSKISFILQANLIMIFSFFGDLIQSYFKRKNNLKDSSKFIPGHGGFFDRFDSFLLVIIPFSIIKYLF